MARATLLSALATLLLACGGDPARDASSPRPDGASTDSGGARRDAQLPPPTEGPLDAASVMFVGHSLIGWELPYMVRSLTRDANVELTFAVQMGAGGTIQLQWERAAEGVYAREELTTGDYDVLVLTEAIPLESNYRFSGTVEFAGDFYDLAQSSHPGARVYMYQTWDEVTDPMFRERLDTDRALWEQIVDEVNAGRTGPPMLMIPGGTALAALVDRIESGGVPGLASRQDLFADQIHVNTRGFYFIACVHHATIYRRSPVGLTNAMIDRFDQPFADPPTPEQARVMQEIAWEIVSQDPRAGLR
ncbi:MAG: hypothetical protein AB7S26_33520 [Sandaracinaceae bacterium]